MDFTATVAPIGSSTNSSDRNGTVPVDRIKWNDRARHGAVSGGVATFSTPDARDRCQLDHRGLLGRRQFHVEQLHRPDRHRPIGEFVDRGHLRPRFADCEPKYHADRDGHRGQPGSGTPTGEVEFLNGSTQVGTGKSQ